MGDMPCMESERDREGGESCCRERERGEREKRQERERERDLL